MNRATGNYFTSLMAWVLFAIFVMFQVLDIWQTYLLLQTGVIQEANPIMRYFFELMGFWIAAIVWKGLVTAFIGGLLVYCQKIDKEIRKLWK